MNSKKLQNWYLHIDLDAFFASVEQLDNPQYRGLPVIVGGRKEDKRGVVSTASYEARKFGVHSAMPIFQALRLCPNGIYLRSRMERYAELSYEIMSIFKDFSPDVEQMSIDEAFVDLTGTEQLFGPPEETAFKIKAKVKEQTGLTVSVGLAPTKYLAKIASGYSKPDGFYFIKPGEEQKFMLELPLKKVWGVGPKALERLKRAGIYTTKDIFDKPFELLNFLFGNTMATFLYNVVRGEEKEVFSRKAKSHSISAENTFSEDITDIYTAETELLELAHGVMFRLLKEEKYSRTVTVKIKYDDFTTVSIQKTLDNNIITLDTFYDNIKNLFEEKYQKGRGIRLLGVGFDKVENNDKPRQQSLFNDKEDKKQAVEKAILNLNKKHPEIKIQKARLLKVIAIFFILISSNFSSFQYKQKLYGEELKIETSKTEEENVNDSGSIFNWDVNDKTNVDFSISGHWRGNMEGSFISTFYKDKPSFFDAPIPIFKQDIELSTLFTINNKWYFEASFADNFANNTLALGYNGDKYFRSGRLSNRNITMPDIYSANELGFGLSGGKNQAPGISAHWQSPYDKWSSDLLLRYDMTEPKSALFYGMNKVTDISILPENYLRSYSFTFPTTVKQELKEIKDIYIECDNGPYKAKNGLNFKKISSTDYYYSEKNNILYLSQSIKNNIQQKNIPNILITFNSPLSVDKIISATGTYTDETSYAGKIQKIFGKKYNLDDFSYKLKNVIGNESALVLQNPEGFSPYIIANTYDCGSNKNIEITVISKNTKQINPNYIAETENISYITPYEDFFDKQHTYSKVKSKNLIDNRFPFADTNPEIYLNINSQNENVLQVRTYNSVSKINIGQKASSGTINVIKNGAYTSDYIYNVNTGDIILSEPINNNDQIKITWEEEASNFAQGTFSLGLGFQLNILPELKWDIALTAQKPINFDNTYTTPDNIKSSFVAISTGLKYIKNDFSISDKAAFSLKKQNDSDKLLISTQNNFTPKNYVHKINSGYEIETDLFLNNKIFYKKDNFTINSHKGEKDKNIEGYKIPLQWDFSHNKQENNSWAAVDLKLDGGSDLKNSSKLNISLCIPKQIPDAIKNYNFYIQLGVKAGTDFISQNKNIPTFDITNKIDFSKSEWQNIEIDLSQKDRSYLTSNKDCRFIVIKNPKINDNEQLKGKIYLGPYSPIVQSIFTEADNSIILTTTSVPSSKDYFSSEIKWFIENDIPSKSTITAESYFTPSDFNPYKVINIKFAYENKSSSQITTISSLPELSITLDTESYTNSKTRQNALKLDLFKISPYVKNIKDYHTISIKKDNVSNSNSYSVYIDNVKLNKSDYKLYINQSVIPSKVKYEINTILDNKLIKNGSFYVDNITFEESDYIYSIDNRINANYKKHNILTINNYPILSDGFLHASSSQKFSDNNVNVLSFFNSGITVTGLSFQTDMLLKQLDFQNAGHNIKTVSPIIDIFSFDESYRWNKQDLTLEKSNDFNLSLESLNIPFNLDSSLSAKETNIQKEQNHNTTLNSNFKIKNNDFNITSSFSTDQKINILKNNNVINDISQNYFDSWFNITKLQFSTGSTLASIRNVKLTNSFFVNIYNDFIIPTIIYDLSSSYENIIKPTFTDTEFLKLSLPIKFKNNSLSFDISRTGGNSENINHHNKNEENAYFSDMEKLFSLQSEREWFYSSIPFYELFDQTLCRKINGNYSSKYEISYSKDLYNSFKDLFIPSHASFAIIRDIKSEDSFSDSYQLKTTLTNTSINNFGKNSEKQIFKWFEQEEISSSITAIVKIPVDLPENTTYKIASFMQILLILGNNSILNNMVDFSFETNLNWHTKMIVNYTRPGKNCLMSAMASFFFENIKPTDFNISRTDSLTISVGTADKINRQQYSYNHYVEMGFLQHFALTNGIGVTFNYTENNSSQLSIDYSLGGKVTF